MQTSVSQSFQYEEFIRTLNEQKELRIVEPKENKTIFGFYIDKSLPQSKDWYDLVSKLAYIQEKTKHIIPMPTKITKNDLSDIYALIRVINTGEDKGTLDGISMKSNKQGAKNLIKIAKKNGKISNLEISQASTYGKLFGENIPLGPSKLILPGMQFVVLIKEVEEQVEKTPEKGYISISLKPVENNTVTIKFENWVPKK